jgi:hypothetical protein
LATRPAPKNTPQARFGCKIQGIKVEKLKAYHSLICFSLCLILLVSCAGIQAPFQMEQPTYLTPIPESTLMAYREGTPIGNKLQAVIAASALLSNSPMENIQPPEVIYVQRITLAEAIKKTTKPGEQTFEDIPPQTPVWLVVFKGTWQVYPDSPGNTGTLPPPYHGCQSVWITEANNGYSATCAIDCPGK